LASWRSAAWWSAPGRDINFHFQYGYYSSNDPARDNHQGPALRLSSIHQSHQKRGHCDVAINLHAGFRRITTAVHKYKALEYGKESQISH
jgi:hypothetical protein